MSLLPLNLVAEALSEMMRLAGEADLIRSLIPDLMDGGLNHLQYADHMVLFLWSDQQSILNLNLVLVCYEEMSGMRINYSKSEIFSQVSLRRLKVKQLQMPLNIWSFLSVTKK